MTELMKRYETETGERATFIYIEKDSDGKEKSTNITTGGFDSWAIREAERLNEENAKLKDQLQWRSADIPPNVDGLYVVTKRDESPRWDKSYHLVRFKNGEWKVDLFSGGYVYSYFNVPIPAPEGE